MAKEVTSQIKLQIPAGKANPAPPCWSIIRAAWGEYYGVL